MKITSDSKICDLVDLANRNKKLFTAGPASLVTENITGLMPCFGRGDASYLTAEEYVLDFLKDMTGHQQMVRLQGSASLAIEIMISNFLSGRVLVISTGYYSDRLRELAEMSFRNYKFIQEITIASFEEAKDMSINFDWVLACSVETSTGFRIPIKELGALAQAKSAKLMLDATASIGLEEHHELADVLAYSSCKGLFGLTGAAFIAFNQGPAHSIDSFYLNLDSHIEKRMTGPYHSILSLLNILPRHKWYRESVIKNKEIFCDRFKSFLTVPQKNQPWLCTHVSCSITAVDESVVLYQSRGLVDGSIVCHLGEAHLGGDSKGKILESIKAR